VALTWRSSRRSALETAAAVRDQGARAFLVKADLASDRSPREAVRAVRRELGGPDILIGMASLYDRTPLADLDERAWRENHDANLRSVYLMALEAAPHMRKRGGGRIVTFADWLPASGRPRYRGYLPYYASKAGVIGLTEALALELAPAILVNAHRPRADPEASRLLRRRRSGSEEGNAPRTLGRGRRDRPRRDVPRRDGVRHRRDDPGGRRTPSLLRPHRNPGPRNPVPRDPACRRTRSSPV
jgi:NAD(P)-dependent dehydrogenase (short-subunit alcohol dehydrogenase family)